MQPDPFAPPAADTRVAHPRADSFSSRMRAERQLRQVRRALVFIVALDLASVMWALLLFFLMAAEDFGPWLGRVGVDVVSAALFAGLRVWSARQPLIAIAVATLLYGVLEVPALLFGSTNLVLLVVRSLIFLILVRGLVIAWKLHLDETSVGSR